MNTKQQEFDLVVAHLYKQGRPAKTEDGECLYRAEGGLKCAVGCRIPDAIYVPEMDKVADNGEGTALHSIIARFGSKLPEELVQYDQLFGSLQWVHDGCETNADGTFVLDKLANRLGIIAKRYDLTFIPPAV